MKGNYIVLDCETGGLDCTKNPITQLAMVGVDAKTGKDLGRYETYIQPYNDFKLEPVALQKTMIDVNDLHRGRLLKDTVKDVMNFCKHVSGGKLRAFSMPVMVGHNVGFDASFLEVAFYLAGKRIQECFASNNDVLYIIDTQQLARIFWPTASSIKLGDCCERAGIKLVDAHGAMNDTLATKNLFLWYKKQISQLQQSSNQSENGEEVVIEKSNHRKFFSI